MAREKKPVHKVRMTEGKRNIIHQLLEEYDIQTAEDIQEAYFCATGCEKTAEGHYGFKNKYILRYIFVIGQMKN